MPPLTPIWPASGHIGIPGLLLTDSSSPVHQYCLKGRLGLFSSLLSNQLPPTSEELEARANKEATYLILVSTQSGYASITFHG